MKENDWDYTFERELPLVLVNIGHEAYTKEMLNQIGWAFKSVMFVSQNGLEKSYRGKRDGISFKEFIKQKISQNPIFISKIKEKLKLFSEEYTAVFKEIKKENLKEKSNLDLLNLYQRAYEAELKLDSLFQFPVYLEKYAGDIVVEENVIKELAKLRDFASKPIYDAYRENYYGLFTEIAGRLNLTPTLVTQMTPKEILETLKNGKLTVSEEILKERFRFYVLITKNNQTQLLTGKEAEELVKQEIFEEDLNLLQETSGVCAYAGKAIGKARIIKGESELNKLQENEIIISPMTSVNFTPYLHKIKAIVTNEGGLTCHAAVIAREMQIPTIIGTENATKIFKDGDLVEVDADKGIVRKINVPKN